MHQMRRVGGWQPRRCLWINPPSVLLGLATTITWMATNEDQVTMLFNRVCA